jgi:hypothetical protein
MKASELDQCKNPDLIASYAALKRAALSARELAKQTNTGIVVFEDGKIRRISADELKRQDGQ